MSGLDSLLMSDLEIWITLASLGSVALVFVPALSEDRWDRRRSSPKLAVAIFLVVAALGGLAWYGVPASPSATTTAMADTGPG
jgi:nitric oxide reductase large subunit